MTSVQYNADGKRLVDECKCFLANLGYKSTPESLTAFFKQFGEVDHVKIIYDASGSSKGFGFLWMMNKEDCVKVAQAAVPDGFTVDGRFGVHANYHSEGRTKKPNKEKSLEYAREVARQAAQKVLGATQAPNILPMAASQFQYIEPAAVPQPVPPSVHQPMLPPPAAPAHEAPITVEIEVDPDVPIPDMFRCGIDGELMDEPVTAADGHSYEKFNIERHLKRKKTSPKTSEPLDHTMLVPNSALKMMINAWKKKNALSKEDKPASSPPTAAANPTPAVPKMPASTSAAVATAVAKAFLAAAQAPTKEERLWEVCCKPIPKGMSSGEIKVLMQQFGDIDVVSLHVDVLTPYAFVRYKKAESMNEALEKGSGGVKCGEPYEGSFITVLPANPKPSKKITQEMRNESETFGRHQIFIRNMPFTLTAEDLTLLFGPFGHIVSTKVLTEDDPNKPGQLKSRGCGFVEFSTEQEMLMAVQGGNDIHVSGRNLVVQDADRKKRLAPAPIQPVQAAPYMGYQHQNIQYQQPPVAAYQPQQQPYGGYQQPQQAAYQQQPYVGYPTSYQQTQASYQGLYQGYANPTPPYQPQYPSYVPPAQGHAPLPANTVFSSVPDVGESARPDDGGGKRMRYE
mmetsp:Transcript_21279/g.39956  ORF Transcript_21279/g.39956 Transcript_21279/m.39956 type:complete len:625 (+) Transcript_21279:323-2197(+)|eukprot:CAMPEP_0182490732 /NCGR_PEP_ID=MMETSP1321-20130603/483_1 /TAXON_ID=91990 /ORGANISM="Bolidomonas sp., Strain RCC1657" /LENGTH=624 /DNA_ID=CAMNT_0024692959 /DNA_START=287 /DNA_END=2161 /DNA_ORIENTATION=-